MKKMITFFEYSLLKLIMIFIVYPNYTQFNPSSASDAYHWRLYAAARHALKKNGSCDRLAQVLLRSKKIPFEKRSKKSQKSLIYISICAFDRRWSNVFRILWEHIELPFECSITFKTKYGHIINKSLLDMYFFLCKYQENPRNYDDIHYLLKRYIQMFSQLPTTEKVLVDTGYKKIILYPEMASKFGIYCKSFTEVLGVGNIDLAIDLFRTGIFKENYIYFDPITSKDILQWGVGRNSMDLFALIVKESQWIKNNIHFLEILLEKTFQTRSLYYLRFFFDNIWNTCDPCTPDINRKGFALPGLIPLCYEYGVYLYGKTDFSKIFHLDDMKVVMETPWIRDTLHTSLLGPYLIRHINDTSDESAAVLQYLLQTNKEDIFYGHNPVALKWLYMNSKHRSVFFSYLMNDYIGEFDPHLLNISNIWDINEPKPKYGESKMSTFLSRISSNKKMEQTPSTRQKILEMVDVFVSYQKRMLTLSPNLFGCQHIPKDLQYLALSYHYSFWK